MATPGDMAAALRARLGRPYWSADGRRMVDDDAPGNDCSGWQVVGARACGVEPGGFVSMPSGMNHFAWATTETIVQVHGNGPFAIVYVNAADDPSKAP